MFELVDVVAYSRDRHPPDHCSFREQGGPWPPHCVDGTPGFELHADLPVVPGAWFVDKASMPDRDAYSDFDGTDLAERLRQHHIKRCVVVGLATDYCVCATVRDAIKEGFETWVLTDAIAPVEVKPGDGTRAILAMREAGAHVSDTGQIVPILESHRAPTAILVVDVQNDFCTGGALAVADAERILKPIAKLLRQTTGYHQ